MRESREITQAGETEWQRLAGSLFERVTGEVAFDAGRRALYTTDASNYRHAPLGVALPRTVEDVVATVAACREFDVPVIARGGGTSVAGNACGPGVVVDTSRHLGGVLDLDPSARTARVLPGTVLDHLQSVVAPHDLRFGPDPSTGLGLAELPRYRVLAVLGFADDVAAADAVPEILPSAPLTVEGVDAELVGLLGGSRARALHRVSGDHRPGDATHSVADPGGRGGIGHPPCRRFRSLAGVGGRRGPAGAARRVSARIQRAHAGVRKAARRLRSLRRRLPAHAAGLRPVVRAGGG